MIKLLIFIFTVRNVEPEAHSTVSKFCCPNYFYHKTIQDPQELYPEPNRKPNKKCFSGAKNKFFPLLLILYLSNSSFTVVHQTKFLITSLLQDIPNVFPQMIIKNACEWNFGGRSTIYCESRGHFIAYLESRLIRLFLSRFYWFFISLFRIQDGEKINRGLDFLWFRV